jgi:hypothetical protein
LLTEAGFEKDLDADKLTMAAPDDLKIAAVQTKVAALLERCDFKSMFGLF